MVDIPAIISTGQTALSALKTATELARGPENKDKGATDELVQKIITAQSEVISLQMLVRELIEENSALKDAASKQDEWKERAAQYGVYDFGRNHFVMKYNGTDEPEHFACPTCFERDKMIIRLHRKLFVGGRIRGGNQYSRVEGLVCRVCGFMAN